MRTLPILLLLSVALASAGCFGKDDGEDPPATTTPAGTTTPTGSTTPTGTTPGNNTNTTPTTPARPAPRELCALSFDFSQNTQPAAPPTHVTAADCGTVPAGYTTVTLTGNFTAGTPPVSGGGIAVTVLDAAAASAATCAGPGAGPVTGPVACSGSGSVTPGAYTIRYDGTGGVAFAGSVIIS